MSSIFAATVLLNVYAALLVLLRAPLFQTKLYRPMLWNIWLSVLPVIVLAVGSLSGIILLLVSRPAAIIVLVVTAVVWLLLLPNASYLITELNFSHRRDDDRTPLWYDIILVISLAMSGVANAVVNVFIAHIVFAITIFGDAAQSLNENTSIVFVIVIMLLVSFGMYLGRYPRFNSWDLKHPVGFVRKLTGHFSERNNVLTALGFTITHAAFLALMYYLIVGPVVEGLMLVEQVRLGG
ncbi:DUF1361 domain-containing protein [Leucobacter sp. cx-42]|uniref:DUF1361 domain-containing protein n=1 Tax=unclassified Leucobacter TaxID=2621730 RepID=UPI00165E6F5B|nr:MULTISPECIES: DUF1361 domain-containing protein [unclassified Leucobacter]MBC9955026.1 DUF1361 domain-containing protein [Leucobacter sp. cx-42]